MNNLRHPSDMNVEQQLVQFLASERLLNPEYRYVIQAGYFENDPDAFARASLQSSLALQEALQSQMGASPKVFTLRNDIATNCDLGCDLSARTIRHADWEVPIIRERTALNRGLRRLRKLLKTNPEQFTLETNGADSVVILTDDQASPINIAISRGDQLIGLCPLLLASFYEMILREEDSNTILIDYCHHTEIQKVAMAARVLNAIFRDVDKKPRAVIAAALDSEGKNLTPFLL